MIQRFQRLVLLAGLAACLVVSGVHCIGNQIMIESNCGNGEVDDGEECDDGNTTAGDGCDATCLDEPTAEDCTDGVDNDEDGLVDCEDPDCVGDVCGVCGNGLVDPGEECDDGNAVAGDGCAPDCTLETVAPETDCEDRVDNDGDGLMDCDDPDCTNDPFCLCGNGLLDNPAEQCDDGNNTDGDGCSSSCQVEQPMCGNGLVEGAEECDGSDLDGNTCEILGYTGGTLSCSGLCLFVETACTGPLCGNGIAEAGEACDDGNGDWCDGCSPTCELSPTAETDCGNGIDEDCDGATDCADSDCSGAPGCP